MIPIPAIVLCAVFLALSAVHIYWVLSGGSGLDAAVPTQGDTPLFQPGSASTLLVAAALFLAALVSMWRGAYLQIGPSWIPRVGIWVLAAIFALRAIGDFRYIGIFKRVRDTKFARNDTLFFSPLCVAISGLALWLALGY